MKLTACLLFSAVFVSGCASPRAYRSGRDGLLDDTGERSIARRGHKARESIIDLDQATGVKGDVEQVGFRWPLSHVEVTSSFGKRGEDMHEGVDLRASTGTSVYASAPGTVIYSGNQIRGYGKLVVIRHPSGLSSIYAHNSKLLVIKGQKMKRGQLLARSGQSGHASGPHVHFEIRKGVTPMDPERAIARTLVALPADELKASSRARLAASDLTRDDSGKPPISGLRRSPGRLKQVAARAAERRRRNHRQRAVAYRPSRVQRGSRVPAAARAKRKASSTESYPATSENNE